MSFETWWDKVQFPVGASLTDASRIAFNAGSAEMRELLACGHPAACQIVKGGDGSDRLGQTYWQECTVCAEIAALKAERDKLREVLQVITHKAGSPIGSFSMEHQHKTMRRYLDEIAQLSNEALLASAPKEE